MVSDERRALAPALLLVCTLVACSGRDGGAPSGAPQAPVVTVAPVVRQTLQDTDEFTARLEATQTVTLRAQVGGILQQVHFREGQRVSRGQLLFTLDARPYAVELKRAQADLAAARSRAELARSELARAERLLPAQAISAQQVDELRATQRTSESAVATAQAGVQAAELNLAYTRITAPFAGRISRSEISVGNLVQAGQTVLSTLVSTDQVYAYFDAPESTYLRLAGGGAAAAAKVQVSMGLSHESGHPHAGQLDFVDNRLDPATGSIRARAVFDNAQGRFTPGLSARLKVGSGQPYEATLVPDLAIATDQTRQIVLVVGANNLVEARPVQPGQRVGELRVVTGVKPGEKIIVNGMQRAFPGAPVSPQAASAPAAAASR